MGGNLYSEIWALMLEREYLAWPVSVFLAQWACEHSIVLCRDIISHSAVYQNLLRTNGTSHSHSLREEESFSPNTRSVVQQRENTAAILLTHTVGQKSKKTNCEREMRCYTETLQHTATPQSVIETNTLLPYRMCGAVLDFSFHRSSK